jgi:hypothetical protein
MMADDFDPTTAPAYQQGAAMSGIPISTSPARSARKSANRATNAFDPSTSPAYQQGAAMSGTPIRVTSAQGAVALTPQQHAMIESSVEVERDRRQALAVSNWITFVFCAGCAAAACGLMWWVQASDSTPDASQAAWLPLLQLVTVVGGLSVGAFVIWWISLESRVRRK